jgi:hypothetical protein
VASAGGTADGPAVHLHIADAAEGVTPLDDTLLQTGGHHHRLKGRTGLILGVQTLAAPLLELGLAEGLGVLLLGAGSLDLFQLGQKGGIIDGVVVKIIADIIKAKSIFFPYLIIVLNIII